MSRPQRIIYENAYYHVMNRGAGREKISNDRIDREIFLQTRGEACHQFCIEVQAYCLMDNHYHFQAYSRPTISAVISEVALLIGEEANVLITMKKGGVKSNTPRKMAIYIARKYGDYRLQELADAFGLYHYGGVSYAVHAFEKKLQEDRELEMSVYNVVNKLRVQYQLSTDVTP